MPEVGSSSTTTSDPPIRAMPTLCVCVCVCVCACVCVHACVLVNIDSPRAPTHTPQFPLLASRKCSSRNIFLADQLQILDHGLHFLTHCLAIPHPLEGEGGRGYLRLQSSNNKDTAVDSLNNKDIAEWVFWWALSHDRSYFPWYPNCNAILSHTLSRQKNLKCSSTVSRLNSTLCCGQMPRLWRIWSMLVRILKPLMVAEPDVGVKRPGGREGGRGGREGGEGGREGGRDGGRVEGDKLCFMNPN